MNEIENIIENLEVIFRNFAGQDQLLPYSRFLKLIKDCELEDRKFLQIDAYMIFNKLTAKVQVKKLNYIKFKEALASIAQKKQWLIEDLVKHIGLKGMAGPHFHGTNASYNRLYEESSEQH
jgi:hypothetical protein